MKRETSGGRFTAKFQSTLKPGQQLRLRPDLWAYYVSWPIVYILGRTRITPNQVGFVSLISGFVFIGMLFTGMHHDRFLWISVFLAIRILLDCADGQLARYSSQTSSLGALYDLVSDFLFNLLFSIASAYALIRYWGEGPSIILLLATTGFLCSTAAATVHSYFSAFFSLPEEERCGLRQQFVQPPDNDHPDRKTYSNRLGFFCFLFNITWGFVSRLVLVAVGTRRPSGSGQFFLLLLSPAEYTIQLLVLLLILLLRIDLVYYYLFQIGSLGFALGLTIVFGRQK